MNRTHIVLATLVLTGCAETSSAPMRALPSSCDLVTSASVTHTVDATCFGCEAADVSLSADGDYDTFAYVGLPLAYQAGVSLRATAATGTSFASGRTPAVALKVDKLLSVQYPLMLEFRTYLNGVLRESIAQEERNGVVNAGVGSSGLLVLSFTTTQSFDALELNFNGTFEGLSAEVYEFCSDT